ncbi:uncharacterized protein V1518DRAFT_359058, partial [Limtongia smithiae]|uniref:uncharacterized protein n=1 Tax=Limtongia smithiae TaxID=1125753 RepID=UPI0034CDF4AC
MSQSKLNIYKSFLASPLPTLLVPDNAHLVYVTSCKSFVGADAIVTHLRQSTHEIRRTENVLFAHESDDALVLETITRIEFVNGAGAYAPGLDMNFVVNNAVTVPIVHIVEFEGSVVKNVRMSWDQGTMLKQLKVIGAVGNPWPIFSGEQQQKAIMAAKGYGCALQSNNTRTDAANVITAATYTTPQTHQQARVAQEPPFRHTHASAAQNFSHFAFGSGSPEHTIPASAVPERVPSPNILHKSVRQQQQLMTPRASTAKNFSHFAFGTPDHLTSTTSDAVVSLRDGPQPRFKTRTNMRPQPDTLQWDYDSQTGVDEDRVAHSRRGRDASDGYKNDMQYTFEITDVSPAP